MDVHFIDQEMELNETINENTLKSPINDANDSGTLNSEENLKFSMDTLIKSFLVMATKLKRNMTYTDAETMVKLIDACNDRKSPNLSRYHWKKIVDQYSDFMSIHHFCDKCHRHIGEQPKIIKDNDMLHCKNCNSDCSIQKNIDSHNIFIYLSLRHQLTQLFQRVHNQIINPMDREKLYTFRDIFDGELYKKNYNNMTVSINFSLDGTPIFESSNFSIYPILCLLNELPVDERRKNIMLVSLWFGKGKPTPIREYLKPFVDECILLYKKGFSYEYEGQDYTKRCRVLNCVCDSVQRPIMGGSTQFNREFGCGLCLHPGKRVEKGRGYVRVYPEIDNTFFGQGLRNHKDTLTHAKNHEFGMKEKSILCKIPEFDIIKNIDVDWMHFVGLGVCRQFGNLWFDSINHAEKFYFGHFVEKINKMLIFYKPSLDISRTSRSMSDRAYWKAHEWVIWLLFYSIPTLECFFPRKYVEHWSLLVEGVAILLNESTLKSEIYYAENCLLQFIKETKSLYGEQHVSFNVDLLAHLAQSVINWGPLFTHNAFMYEDYNQQLQSYVKSSNGVSLQICETFRMKIAVEVLEKICSDCLSFRQKKYIDELFNRQHQSANTLEIKRGQMVIGNCVQVKNIRNYIIAFHRKNIIVSNSNEIHFYTRARIDKKLVHSSLYSTIKVKKRNSYTVQLKDESFFEIELFAILHANDTNSGYAIGYYYEVSNKKLSTKKLEHLVVLKKKEFELTVVSLDEIKEKVTLLNSPRLKKTVACILSSHNEFLT